MLPSLTVIKAIRTRWLLIVTAVIGSVTMGFYLLKRPLQAEQPRSHLSDAHRAGMNVPAASSESVAPTLRVTSIVQHGRIVEIHGTTDPGAIVMINGQPAATIFDPNEFRHFVGPLPAGTSIVTVTSQNDRGGVNTQQMAVTVE